MEADAIAAVDRPGTAAGIAGDLRELGVRPGSVLLVHCSLSALGFVAGGAQAVVAALLDVIGPTGTLVVPTQSGQLTDPAGWRHPPVPAAWVDEVRDALPAYDPAITPTREMGQVAECVRHLPGAVRSAHPTCSFAAAGPAATRPRG